MDKVKLAIIFYSMGGTNYQLAKWAAEGASEVNAEVKLFKVPEIAPLEIVNSNPTWKKTTENTKDIPHPTDEDLMWADAIIMSVPTRFGNMASQLKQFLDSKGGLWAKGGLVNKVFSAMSSAQNPHGGQEATILSLYTTMMHWGVIIVPPGYTDSSIIKAGGNPYGTSVTVDKQGIVGDVKDAIKYQAKRTVEVASWIKKGKNL